MIELALKPSQIIVKHFVDTFNYKFTGVLFKKELGIANSLIKAGFTPEEIIMCIDYLKEHPPTNGLRSLAYLQYVINDILPKAKVKKLNTVQKVFSEEEELDENLDDNMSKFNRFSSGNNKLRI